MEFTPSSSAHLFEFSLKVQQCFPSGPPRSVLVKNVLPAKTIYRHNARAMELVGGVRNGQHGDELAKVLGDRWAANFEMKSVTHRAIIGLGLR